MNFKIRCSACGLITPAALALWHRYTCLERQS